MSSVNSIGEINSSYGAAVVSGYSEAYLAILEDLGYNSGVDILDNASLSARYAALKGVNNLVVEDNNYLENLGKYDFKYGEIDGQDSFFVSYFDEAGSFINEAFGYSDLTNSFNSVDSYINPFDQAVIGLLNELYNQNIINDDQNLDQKITALYNYIINNFSYINEEKDDWNFAGETILQRGGDCEDLSILLASLGMAMLINEGVSYEEANSRFAVVAGNHAVYGDHVYVEYTHDNGTVYILDASVADQGAIGSLADLLLATERDDFTIYYRFNDNAVLGTLPAAAENKTESYIDPKNSTVQEILTKVKAEGYYGPELNLDQLVTNTYKFLKDNYSYLDLEGLSINYQRSLSTGSLNSESFACLMMSLVLAAVEELGFDKNSAAEEMRVAVLENKDGESTMVFLYDEYIFDLSGKIVKEDISMANCQVFGEVLVLYDLSNFPQTYYQPGLKELGSYDLENNIYKRTVNRFTPKSLLQGSDGKAVVKSRKNYVDSNQLSNVSTFNPYSALGSGKSVSSVINSLSNNYQGVFGNNFNKNSKGVNVDPDNPNGGLQGKGWFNDIKYGIQEAMTGMANLSDFVKTEDGFWVFAAADYDAHLIKLNRYQNIQSMIAMLMEEKINAHSIVMSEMNESDPDMLQGREGYKTMGSSSIIKAENDFLSKGTGAIRNDITSAISSRNQLLQSTAENYFVKEMESEMSIEKTFKSFFLQVAIAAGIAMGAQMAALALFPIIPAGPVLSAAADWIVDNALRVAINAFGVATIGTFQVRQQWLKMRAAEAKAEIYKRAKKAEETNNKNMASSLSNAVKAKATGNRAEFANNAICGIYDKLSSVKTINYVNSDGGKFENDSELLALEKEIKSSVLLLKTYTKVNSEMRKSRSIVHQEMTDKSAYSSSSLSEEAVTRELSQVEAILSHYKETRSSYLAQHNQAQTAKEEYHLETTKTAVMTTCFVIGSVLNFTPFAPLALGFQMTLASVINSTADLFWKREYKPPKPDYSYLWNKKDISYTSNSGKKINLKKSAQTYDRDSKYFYNATNSFIGQPYSAVDREVFNDARKDCLYIANFQRLIMIIEEYRKSARDIVHQEMTNKSSYTQSGLPEEALSKELAYEFSAIGAISSRASARSQYFNKLKARYNPAQSNLMLGSFGLALGAVAAIAGSANAAVGLGLSLAYLASFAGKVTMEYSKPDSDYNINLNGLKFKGIDLDDNGRRKYSSTSDSLSKQSFNSYVQAIGDGPKGQTKYFVRAQTTYTAGGSVSASGMDSVMQSFMYAAKPLHAWSSLIKAKSEARSIIHQEMTNVSSKQNSSSVKSSIDSYDQLNSARASSFAQTLNEYVSLKQRQNQAAVNQKWELFSLALLSISAATYFSVATIIFSIGVTSLATGGAQAAGSLLNNILLMSSVVQSLVGFARSIYDWKFKSVDADKIKNSLLNKEGIIDSFSHTKKSSKNAISGRKTDPLDTTVDPYQSPGDLLVLQSKLKELQKIHEAIQKVAQTQKESRANVKGKTSGIRGSTGGNLAATMLSLNNQVADSLMNIIIGLAKAKEQYVDEEENGDMKLMKVLQSGMSLGKTLTQLGKAISEGRFSKEAGAAVWDATMGNDEEDIKKYKAKEKEISVAKGALDNLKLEGGTPDEIAEATKAIETLKVDLGDKIAKANAREAASVGGPTKSLFGGIGYQENKAIVGGGFAGVISAVTIADNLLKGDAAGFLAPNAKAPDADKKKAPAGGDTKISIKKGGKQDNYTRTAADNNKDKGTAAIIISNGDMENEVISTSQTLRGANARQNAKNTSATATHGIINSELDRFDMNKNAIDILSDTAQYDEFCKNNPDHKKLNDDDRKSLIGKLQDQNKTILTKLKEWKENGQYVNFTNNTSFNSRGLNQNVIKERKKLTDKIDKNIKDGGIELSTGKKRETKEILDDLIGNKKVALTANNRNGSFTYAKDLAVGEKNTANSVTTNEKKYEFNMDYSKSAGGSNNTSDSSNWDFWNAGIQFLTTGENVAKYMYDREKLKEATKVIKERIANAAAALAAGADANSVMLYIGGSLDQYNSVTQSAVIGKADAVGGAFKATVGVNDSLDRFDGWLGDVFAQVMRNAGSSLAAKKIANMSAEELNKYVQDYDKWLVNKIMKVYKEAGLTGVSRDEVIAVVAKRRDDYKLNENISIMKSNDKHKDRNAAATGITAYLKADSLEVGLDKDGNVMLTESRKAETTPDSPIQKTYVVKKFDDPGSLDTAVKSIRYTFFEKSRTQNPDISLNINLSEINKDMGMAFVKRADGSVGLVGLGSSNLVTKTINGKSYKVFENITLADTPEARSAFCKQLAEEHPNGAIVKIYGQYYLAKGVNASPPNTEVADVEFTRLEEGTTPTEINGEKITVPDFKTDGFAVKLDVLKETIKTKTDGKAFKKQESTPNNQVKYELTNSKTGRSYNELKNLTDSLSPEDKIEVKVGKDTYTITKEKNSDDFACDKQGLEGVKPQSGIAVLKRLAADLQIMDKKALDGGSIDGTVLKDYTEFIKEVADRRTEAIQARDLTKDLNKMYNLNKDFASHFRYTSNCAEEHFLNNPIYASVLTPSELRKYPADVLVVRAELYGNKALAGDWEELLTDESLKDKITETEFRDLEKKNKEFKELIDGLTPTKEKDRVKEAIGEALKQGKEPSWANIFSLDGAKAKEFKEAYASSRLDWAVNAQKNVDKKNELITDEQSKNGVVTNEKSGNSSVAKMSDKNIKLQEKAKAAVNKDIEKRNDLIKEQQIAILKEYKELKETEEKFKKALKNKAQSLQKLLLSDPAILRNLSTRAFWASLSSLRGEDSAVAGAQLVLSQIKGNLDPQVFGFNKLSKTDNKYQAKIANDQEVVNLDNLNEIGKYTFNEATGKWTTEKTGRNNTTVMENVTGESIITELNEARGELLKLKKLTLVVKQYAETIDRLIRSSKLGNTGRFVNDLAGPTHGKVSYNIFNDNVTRNAIEDTISNIETLNEDILSAKVEDPLKAINDNPDKAIDDYGLTAPSEETVAVIAKAKDQKTIEDLLETAGVKNKAIREKIAKEILLSSPPNKKEKLIKTRLLQAQYFEQTNRSILLTSPAGAHKIGGVNADETKALGYTAMAVEILASKPIDKNSPDYAEKLAKIVKHLADADKFNIHRKEKIAYHPLTASVMVDILTDKEIFVEDKEHVIEITGRDMLQEVLNDNGESEIRTEGIKFKINDTTHTVTKEVEKYYLKGADNKKLDVATYKKILNSYTKEVVITDNTNVSAIMDQLVNAAPGQTIVFYGVNKEDGKLEKYAVETSNPEEVFRAKDVLKDYASNYGGSGENGTYYYVKEVGNEFTLITIESKDGYVLSVTGGKEDKPKTISDYVRANKKEFESHSNGEIIPLDVTGAGKGFFEQAFNLQNKIEKMLNKPVATGDLTGYEYRAWWAINDQVLGKYNEADAQRNNQEAREQSSTDAAEEFSVRCR